jgi:hypothetical protein
LEASVSTIMSQSLDCRRSAGIAAAGLSSSAPAATNAACTAVRFDRRKDRVGASRRLRDAGGGWRRPGSRLAQWRRIP